jgi:RNA polymerase sigma-70 factor (ECF subfamily)
MSGETRTLYAAPPAPAAARDRQRPDSSEAALLAGLQSGEEAAFERLVRAYRRRLLSVARRFLRNHEDARDAVQDTFLLFFRSIHTFQQGAPLSPWLHRILINVSISRLRARRPSASLEEAFCERPLYGRNEPVDAALVRRETHALLRRCIRRLPGAYRRVVLLRYFRELDTEETARRLGVPAGTVKGRLHRARLRMRAALQHQAAG